MTTAAFERVTADRLAGLHCTGVLPQARAFPSQLAFSAGGGGGRQPSKTLRGVYPEGIRSDLATNPDSPPNFVGEAFGASSVCSGNCQRSCGSV